MNRELSWIDFNRRVFYEAKRKTNSDFETLGFLSIVSTNFNEFFQVRVAALVRELSQNPAARDISQKPLCDIMPALYKKSAALSEQVHGEIKKTLHRLEKTGIFCKKGDFDFSDERIKEFVSAVSVSPCDSLSALENQRTYAVFRHESGMSIAQLPKYRIFWLDESTFTTADDLILGAGSVFFPNERIADSFTISVDRDADCAVSETGDQRTFIDEMKKILEARKIARPTRILFSSKTPETTLAFLKGEFPQCGRDEFFFVDGYVHAEFLIGLKKGFHQYDFLRNKRKEEEPFPDMMVRFRSLTKNRRPCNAEIVTSSIFDFLDARDVVVHFPYESYFPVLKFISDAAEDPLVSEIKFTLYRTEHNSRIVNELVLASLKGKRVSVFMEIKARFNEQLNIDLGKILEDAHIRVVYSFPGVKVHAKIALVTRGNAQYAILGTGNFNSETSYSYSDLAVFTSNREMTAGVSRIFDSIIPSAEQKQQTTVRFLQAADDDSPLLTSPFFIKRRLLSLIQNEAKHGENGKIVAKMNNLGDEDIIRELKRASKKGVKIFLNVRGICQLVPDENMTIISIVGKYLEHSRIFFFKNAGSGKLFVSSADWMTRNLDKRLEVMFEIRDRSCFEKIKRILDVYFRDESHAHTLKPDGNWLEPKNALGFCAQEFIERSY